MRAIIKSKPVTVRAWQLGADTPMERKLIREGRIIRHPSGRYEIFSQEARGETGELAEPGDYFKVDSSGYPYPNTREFFEANHTRVGADEYRQLPRELMAWFLGDPADEMIDFLQRSRGLEIRPDRPEACFRAPLWGSVLTAAADAALVIYRAEYDDAGRLCDVDFNFVARDEFEKTYQEL